MPNHQKHIPVLLSETLKYLDPSSGESYLDATAGYGGHASAILDKTKQGSAVLVDRDQNAVMHLKEQFRGKAVAVRHQDFLTASRELQTEGTRFDMILADLGLSSPHLNIASRGFAIQADGPLDMRMDQRQVLTADSIVNTYEEAQLAKVIKRYGEEPKAKKIARLIVMNRPIHTTTELVRIVVKAVGWRKQKRKIHPATRTFQALRIVVNDELALLEQVLPIWIDLLKPGGRVVVISFHSLEDRLVKQAFLEAGGNRYDARLQLLTKHPITGDQTEIVSNPRAKSAKLRAAVKIKI